MGGLSRRILWSSRAKIPALSSYVISDGAILIVAYPRWSLARLLFVEIQKGMPVAKSSTALLLIPTVGVTTNDAIDQKAPCD